MLKSATHYECPTIGEIALPFSGTKATAAAIAGQHRRTRHLHQWKSVCVDFSSKLQRAQIDAVKSVIAAGAVPVLLQ